MIGVRNILFDLDGTLLDTRRGVIRAYQFMLVRLGAEVPSVKDLNWCLGSPLRQNLPRLLSTSDPELVERAARLYRESYMGGAMYDYSLYSGIEDLLKRLAKYRFRLFVATSKPVFFAEQIVQSSPFTSHIERVYGPDFEGNLDDKTELIEHLMTTEKLAPEETVVVGDRNRDIKAGRKARILTVGVTWGYGSPQELADADYLVNSPAEFREIIMTSVDRKG